ncbi:MAG TPA: DNA polymerase III subunit chi [Rhizomicrobium sp.]
MTETLFYHLERRTMEDVLPGLLERTRERNLRALLRVGSAERMEALDAHLWTYSEETFLPHAQLGDGEPSRQPVLITVEETNANNANVLFLVGGAAAPAWNNADTKALSRIVVMFDGRDTNAVDGARTAWRAAKEASHEVTYWKESATGKWEKQG